MFGVTRRAKIFHRCGKCFRVIRADELYLLLKHPPDSEDKHWYSMKVCRACAKKHWKNYL